jgi:hypothetical protein
VTKDCGTVLNANTKKHIAMNSDSNSIGCDSDGVEDCNVLEVPDDALEAAADDTRAALSLNSIGIVAPNCC